MNMTYASIYKSALEVGRQAMNQPETLARPLPDRISVFHETVNREYARLHLILLLETKHYSSAAE